MSEENQIVIEEPAPAPVAAPLPTPEDVKKQGWSKEEIAKAEQRGMLAKPEEKKPVAVKPEGAKPEGEKPEEKPEAKKPAGLPDFTMSPEQERVFLETFGPGTAPRAMYFRMKNERQARQQKDQELQQVKAKLAALEEAMKTPKTIETDEEGHVIDKPLTLKALKELQQQEAERIAKEQEEHQVATARVKDAQLEQEQFAREQYKDYDKTLGLAKDLMQNLDTLLPEQWKQKKALKLIREFQVAAHQADQFGLDDYNAAVMVYELGQLHPKYGQQDNALEESEETGTTKDPKPTGGVKPETMKRIENNTQRRGSSAAVTDGGGKRVVSAQDMDLKTLLGLPAEKRLTFKKNHPDVYDKLMRG
jgi:hypothetical protein